MSFKSLVDLKIKKCDLIDIKLIQLSSAAFVLMIAKLWKPLLILDWYWYTDHIQNCSADDRATFKIHIRLYEMTASIRTRGDVYNE